MAELAAYAALLADIKFRIQAAQSRALLAANSELIQLYWEIGHLLDNRQAAEGWGAAVIPRLASDIHNELPEVKGFSERNFKRMLAFFRAYQAVPGFGSQAVASEHDGKGAAKVPQPVAQMDATMLCAIPWGHHLLLMERVKDVSVRWWYVTRTAAEGWRRV